MKKIIPEISLILVIAFLNLLMVGCSFYRVKPIQPVTEENINQVPVYKYIILHYGNEAWHLTGLTLDNDKKELTGTLEPLDALHMQYFTPRIPGANHYKAKEGNPTVEVHVYAEEYARFENNRVKIPLSSINRINLYEPDKGATTASWVFGCLGGAVGAFVIVMVIVLLTKSSCPLVYVNDGITYRFTGETFGGAVSASSERDDYMPLPGIKPVDGYYDLKISNELLERQYTDVAELLVVDHSDISTAIIDKHGNVQILNDLKSPATATDENNQSVTNALLARDSISYLFNQPNSLNPELSSMVLNFEKPAHAKNAKLVLNTKNSFWLDYIYGKFNEQFGTHFNEFMKKQSKAPPEQGLQWSLDQGIPLSVYVETANGWKFVDYVSTVGPLASRDIVIPVDLSDVKGDVLKLKLECGFMFWEVDYAAVDYSSNGECRTQKIPANSAIDEKGSNIASSLAKVDKEYLYQPQVGNQAILKFSSVPSQAGAKQSVFLHTRGYYEYIRDYKGKPDIGYLRSFREKGAFARFSKYHYDEFVNDKDFIYKALSSGYAK